MGLEEENDVILLTEEESDGILVAGITMRSQLDEHEQKNIESAIQWLLTRTFQSKDIINESFIRKLHKRMYNEVWTWAGEFRKSDKNLGVTWTVIQIELKKLLDDTAYWTQHQIYSPDETAIRFKHRLVSTHCFPNGNGRHSRLMADIIIENLYGLPVFTWGMKNLTKDSDLRKEYISSLKAADQGNYAPLLSFARK